MTATVQGVLDASGLPRAEALTLLARATGATRERLIAGSRDALDPDVVVAFRALTARRRDGEPIAYLLGERAFYGRCFAVDRRVLIPRPETELLVDLALAHVDAHRVPRAHRVLDLGTGSGAIAVTLALERPDLEITATDCSDDALAVARDNARRLDARVAFAAGDWYDALAPTTFDLIVSNPPYIGVDDAHLATGDLRHEPSGALTDGADGLDALRRIVAGAASRLSDGAALMVEHGHRQATAVRRLFAAAGLSAIASHRDLAGIERVTVGRRADGRTDL